MKIKLFIHLVTSNDIGINGDFFSSSIFNLFLVWTSFGSPNLSPHLVSDDDDDDDDDDDSNYVL